MPISHTDRTDSVDTKLRLLRDAHARGEWDLDMSLAAGGGGRCGCDAYGDRTAGLKYLTLVQQIDAGMKRLLWVGRERTERSQSRFFDLNGESFEPTVASMYNLVDYDEHPDSRVMHVAGRAPRQLVNSVRFLSSDTPDESMGFGTYVINFPGGRLLVNRNTFGHCVPGPF